MAELTASAPSPASHRHGGQFRWFGAALALLLAAGVVFALNFQWNWLRGPLADYASGQMHRKVTIQGDLVVHPWSLTPLATAEGVTVTQPAWAGPGLMARIPRLTLSLDLGALLTGRLVLPVVDAEHPVLTLMRDASGRNNWSFGAAGQISGPLDLPPIRHFTINDGHLTLQDARRGLTFAGAISSNEQMTGWGRGRFTLQGQGVMRGIPFAAAVLGGPLLNVDPDRPYGFHADVRSGTTRIVADGSVPHPFHISAYAARLTVTGQDMAKLYDLTGLAFPESPPYEVAGDLKRSGTHYDVTGLTGRIGSTDVAGTMVLDEIAGRPKLTADIASRRLKLVDLTAVFGGAPIGVMKGTILSPEQRAMGIKLAAEHRLLPDAPLDVGRVRLMDADVRYRADSVDAGPVPIRQLSLHARLDHGVITVDPVSLVLPQGALAGNFRIDARGDTPAETVDVRLSNARVQDLLPTRHDAATLEGELRAHASFVSTGASVRTVAANANGAVTLVIPHGQMRQAVAELMGIDVTKSFLMFLSKDNKPTEVRCAVAEFQTRGGVMTARRFLLDTAVMRAEGSGDIDLRNETMNLALSGKPKQFRLIRIAAPITLKGPLSAPRVGVDLGKAAGQIGVGALLGAVVYPVAAVLPLLGVGTAKDADCPALLAEAG